jgi:glutaredoxin 3
MANNITVYTTPFCPYCIRALMLLDRKKVAYEKIAINKDKKLRIEMEQRSGRTSVPQIFIGKTHVGGYDDLAALNRKDQLDVLLEGQKN